MIFEKEKYYKYINQLEKELTIINAIIMIISVLIGIATGGGTLIITIPLGLFISWGLTMKLKIQIQEMKWKFDIYNKVMEKQR